MPPFTFVTDSINNILTAREREYAKTQREKQADASYAASHAVMCLLSDFTPIISHMLQGKGSNVWSHLEGEFIGDVSGVVATVAVQRLAPEAMAAIRTVVEPIARPLYELSSKHEADVWASQHGEIAGSEAHTARIAKHYEQEMAKLPMGVMWTVTSLLLNSTYQLGKTALSNHYHLNLPNLNTDSFGAITASNAEGALITFALTNGLRVALPRQTHKIDRFAREYIAEPVSNFAREHIAEPVSNIVDSITGHGTLITELDKQPAV